MVCHLCMSREDNFEPEVFVRQNDAPRGLRGGHLRCKCTSTATDSNNRENVHRAFAYAWVAVDWQGNLMAQNTRAFTEYGVAGPAFINELLDWEETFKKYLKRNVPCNPTDEELEDFLQADKCCLCGEPFDFNYDYYPAMYHSMRNKPNITDTDKRMGEAIVLHHQHTHDKYSVMQKCACLLYTPPFPKLPKPARESMLSKLW